MKFIAAAAVLCLFAAEPAAAEIEMTGSRDFGLDSFSPRVCADTPASLNACRSDKAAPKKTPGRGFLRVSGEAKMGLVYDDSRINPRSKVSIIFGFGMVTDGGLRIGGSAKIGSD